MELDDFLIEISKDKRMNAIFNKINSIKYQQMSLAEKKILYKEFVKIISKKLELDINITFNKYPKEYIDDVSFFEYDETIIINGLAKNPYIYLKDILITMLLYKYEDYDIIDLGDVYFDCNYKPLISSLMLYNKDNYPIVNKAIKFIDSMISNADNIYKGEYEKCLDKVITKEALEEINHVYNIFDEYIKDPYYNTLLKLNEKIEDLKMNFSEKKEDLALFSLDNILSSFIGKIELDGKYEESLNIHLKKFIEIFFNEYKDDINILLKDELLINNRGINDQELFIDVLMQEIEKIENANPRIESIISNNLFNQFNKDGNNYSKLEIYFLLKMKELDSYLSSRDLEMINYFSFEKTFKNNKNLEIYPSLNESFVELSNNKQFVSLVEQYIHSKEENINLLYEIFYMLNGAYPNDDFKLIIDSDSLTNTSQGISDDDTIYINLKNNKDKKMVVATLFHEYRHLMQVKEIKSDSGIYNKYLRRILGLNFYKTPFGYDYSYATSEEVSYHNDMFYNLQPCEFDAEWFSKELLKRVFSQFKKKIKIDFNDYYTGLYSELRFLDNKQISLVSYEKFLNLDKVIERINMEKELYKSLVEKINQMETYNDALTIYHMPMFIDLDIDSKLKVYDKLANNEMIFKYINKEGKVLINGKEYKKSEINDYLIVENILLHNFKSLLKRGMINQSQLNEFMYSESRKFKMKEYTIENYCCAYQYHSCFDKYARGYKKKKTSKKDR